ncbi:MAG: hypothetical protein NUV69_05505 [Candidatus Curtissbacteria bacterium]|nr:hypothetical protein [Candidatus Curtissbacteria bacterium]
MIVEQNRSEVREVQVDFEVEFVNSARCALREGYARVNMFGGVSIRVAQVVREREDFVKDPSLALARGMLGLLADEKNEYKCLRVRVEGDEYSLFTPDFRFGEGSVYKINRDAMKDVRPEIKQR